MHLQHQDLDRAIDMLGNAKTKQKNCHVKNISFGKIKKKRIPNR